MFTGNESVKKMSIAAPDPDVKALAPPMAFIHLI